MSDAWRVFLLLLAGDVERNPGPGDVAELKAMMKTMMESQNHLKITIDKLSASQSQLEKTVSSKMAEISDVLRTIQEQSAQIKDIHADLSTLKEEFYFQQKRLDDLEDRSRRRNLVIFGFTEPDREDLADLRTRVVDGIFKEKLGVTVASVERVHRIGKKQSNRPRPVILNFYDYNEKMLVLKNCSKLKGSSISISHDYCRATLDKRKKLWGHAKEYKVQGRRVSLDYDKLRVDEDTYVWDESSDSIKLLRQSKKVPSRQ